MGNKANSKPATNFALVISGTEDETKAASLARALLGPEFRHGFLAANFSDKYLGPNITEDLPSLMDHKQALDAEAAKAKEGDLSMASRLLTAQALTLDAMFTQLMRKSFANLGESIEATETYGRLAFKAQSNCRATLEALAKLHQPREQTVRHVHVNDGGQAIVADHFHHHKDGGINEKQDEQSHATAQFEPCEALPS